MFNRSSLLENMIINHQIAGMTAFLDGGYSLNFSLYHLWLMVAAISWLTTTQNQTGTKLKVLEVEEC